MQVTGLDSLHVCDTCLSACYGVLYSIVLYSTVFYYVCGHEPTLSDVYLLNRFTV